MRLLAALAGLLAWSCSHSFTSSVTGSLLDPNIPRSGTTTVRISAAGVGPNLLHLDAPVTVTFTNDDSVAHRLEPAPELGYGRCAPIDQLGTLPPGQSGQVTLEQRQLICTFRDAAGPSNQAFQGFIVIH
jgi:hypothetical protein